MLDSSKPTPGHFYNDGYRDGRINSDDDTSAFRDAFAGAKHAVTFHDAYTFALKCSDASLVDLMDARCYPNGVSVSSIAGNIAEHAGEDSILAENYARAYAHGYSEGLRARLVESIHEINTYNACENCHMISICTCFGI